MSASTTTTTTTTISTDSFSTPLQWSQKAYELAETGASSQLESLLVEHPDKIDLNLYRNSEGETTLHCVCLHTDVQTVRLCVDNGARINAPDNKGETPLHKAARRGRSELVKTLLELKATTEATDGYGGTALHSAANAGHADCVKFMLESKADSSAENSRGKTARFLAYIKRFMRVVQVIDHHNNVHGKHHKQHDATGYNHTVNPAALALSKQAFVLAGRSEHLLRQFLETHTECNVNLYRNELGFNALHRASASGKVPVMSVLLEHKADIRSKDNQGNTALHRAASNGGVQALRFLLDSNADITTVNKTGQTARDMAAQRSNGHALLSIVDTAVQQQSPLGQMVSSPSSSAMPSSSLMRLHQPMSALIGGLETSNTNGFSSSVLNSNGHNATTTNNNNGNAVLSVGGLRSSHHHLSSSSNPSSSSASSLLSSHHVSRPKSNSLDHSYHSLPIQQWSSREVQKWAYDNHLDFFSEELKQQNVNGQDLLELHRAEDVIATGLTSRKIKAHTFISKLNKFTGMHSQTATHGEMLPRCVICRTRGVDTLLMPCSHLCMCRQCVSDVGDAMVGCPICQTRFEKAVLVLYP